MKKWTKEELEQIHPTIVADGRYDALPHSDYAIGDLVAIRTSPRAHSIVEIQGNAMIVLGKDEKTGEEYQIGVSRDIVRPANAYVKLVASIIDATVQVEVDRHGHGLLIYPEGVSTVYLVEDDLPPSIFSE